MNIAFFPMRRNAKIKFDPLLALDIAILQASTSQRKAAQNEIKTDQT